MSALNAVPGSITDPGNPAPATGATASLRVTTAGYTNRYVRHQASLGYTAVVDAGSGALLKAAATWRIRPGLSNGGCWSFESRNVPGSYLRHRNSRARIDADDGSALFRADATWCPRNVVGGVRLAAANFSQAYLRHINGEVWLATPGGANGWDGSNSFVPDSTWSIAAPWTP